MQEESAENAMKLLRRLGEADRESDCPAANAISYLGQMCCALDEQDFRVLGLEPSPSESLRIRRKRITTYHRYRELFEVEIAYAREQKREAMAFESNWSSLGQYVSEGMQLAKRKWMLRIAGWLYRCQLPGAKDQCEAAAYGLFKMLYLPAAK